jgi:PmbA protein
MIDDLLARAGRAGAQAGDAMLRHAETTTLTFEAGRLKAGTVTAERGVNLRVLVDGRVGVAGSTAADPTAVVDAALESARLGETVALTFPEAGPLPAVRTESPATRDASLDALESMGRQLVERLAGEGRQVGITVERETGETRVVNTTGREAAYATTQVAVVAEVTRVAHDDVLIVYDYHLAVDLPAPDELDRLAADIARRLTEAASVVDPPEGALPVVFTPHGLAAVLLPIEQGLHGKAVLQGVSPLADKTGEQVFDPAVTLVDDPLTDGAPASRPVDDEGVASRRLRLIEAGVVRSFVYDLETATRTGCASTGHGARGIFGKPRASYTNLRLESGDRQRADLLAGVRDGLVVDELIGVGQGNVASGAFSHPVALAYRVTNGEVVGRVKDAAVAGNSFELLARVGGVSSEQRWLGTRQLPWVLLEGVSVSAR